MCARYARVSLDRLPVAVPYPVPSINSKNRVDLEPRLHAGILVNIVIIIIMCIILINIIIFLQNQTLHAPLFRMTVCTVGVHTMAPV